MPFGQIPFSQMLLPLNAIWPNAFWPNTFKPNALPLHVIWPNTFGPNAPLLNAFSQKAFVEMPFIKISFTQMHFAKCISAKCLLAKCFLRILMIPSISGGQHLRDPESNLVRGFEVRERRVHHLWEQQPGVSLLKLSSSLMLWANKLERLRTGNYLQPSLMFESESRYLERCST